MEQPTQPESALYTISRPVQIVETIQTVLTALILAFVFRSFLVEAFIIPTGSMANALLGAHLTHTCPACGWEYNTGTSRDSLCPNCHTRTPLPSEGIVTRAGDRILVHKWPLAVGGMFGLRRWDVIVFRNPSIPGENFIKRLVGLPGDTIEILDGDIFINERIAHKTPAAQSVLWFIVYDQNHVPNSQGMASNELRWENESPHNNATLGWSGLDRRVIRYRGLDEQERAIRFNPHDQRYFQDVYAYNRGPSLTPTPFVGDLRMMAEVTFSGGEGDCRWELAPSGSLFTAEIHRNGVISFWMAPREDPGCRTIFAADVTLSPFRANHPYLIEFGHVDYRVYLKVDGQEVWATTDANYAPDLELLRTSRRTTPAVLRIVARSLELELRGLRVDRDVYYTYRPRYTQRAYADHPFTLGADEYFALGDNSPDSRDSREWTERGAHLPADYRAGTVRSRQIVGPAAFVYLPGLLPMDQTGRLRLPDLGRVRFVR